MDTSIKPILCPRKSGPTHDLLSLPEQLDLANNLLTPWILSAIEECALGPTANPNKFCYSQRFHGQKGHVVGSSRFDEVDIDGEYLARAHANIVAAKLLQQLFDGLICIQLDPVPVPDGGLLTIEGKWHIAVVSELQGERVKPTVRA